MSQSRESHFSIISSVAEFDSVLNESVHLIECEDRLMSCRRVFKEDVVEKLIVCCKNAELLTTDNNEKTLHSYILVLV